MKVVLDCRSVFPGMGGIGRSTAALARHLPPHLGSDELVLLTGARTFDDPLVQAENVTQVQVDAAMIDPTFEQVRLPAVLEDLGADVYHNPCFSVPIVGGDVARVATIHDVVFKRRPELVERRLREYLDRWSHVSCELAQVVVTVSEFSRRELRAVYGVHPSKIDVVPNAADQRFFDVQRQAPKGDPFVLYVGSIEEKKNVHRLIGAFDRLLERDAELPHRLVLVGSLGGGGGDPRYLDVALESAPRVKDRVHALGHVSDETLLSLYASADLFAYLSEYEGFGLPPLEAMAAGVPTLVANRGSLPEVVREGGVLVDPDDEHAVARAMGTLLTEGYRADSIARRGKNRAKQYSWHRSARQLVASYRLALRRLKEHVQLPPCAPNSPPTLRVLGKEDA